MTRASSSKTFMGSQASSLEAMETPQEVTEEVQQELRAEARTIVSGASRKRKVQAALETKRMEEGGLTTADLIATASPEGAVAAFAVAGGHLNAEGDYDEVTVQAKMDEPAPKIAKVIKKSYGLMELDATQIEVHNHTRPNSTELFFALSLHGNKPVVEMVTQPKVYLTVRFNPEHPSYNGDAPKTSELVIKPELTDELLTQWLVLDDHLRDCCKAIPELAAKDWYKSAIEVSERFGTKLKLKIKLIGENDHCELIFKKGDDGPITKGWGKKFYDEQMKGMDCIGCRPIVMLPMLNITKSGKYASSISLAAPWCKQVVFKVIPARPKATISELEKSSNWVDVNEEDL